MNISTNSLFLLINSLLQQLFILYPLYTLFMFSMIIGCACSGIESLIVICNLICCYICIGWVTVEGWIVNSFQVWSWFLKPIKESFRLEWKVIVCCWCLRGLNKSVQYKLLLLLLMHCFKYKLLVSLFLKYKWSQL